MKMRVICTSANFYPRSPCGERPRAFPNSQAKLQFLSTLSLRRATCYSLRHSTSCRHFYPRSPCGERPFEKFEGIMVTKISIHALLAESDPGKIRIFDDIFYFYPRSPCGERHTRGSKKVKLNNFYPRSPCGERRFYPLKTLVILPFLSTLSLRRAT